MSVSDSEIEVAAASLADLSGADRAEGGRHWMTDRRQILKGVHVKVVAMIGSTQISVGQLTGLREGELITLDQDVATPVDLIAEGHVIGRGELVVVGERYGVRVTELASFDGP